MKKTFALFLFPCVIFSNVIAQQSGENQVTLTGLLKSFTDVSSLPAFETGTVAQVSSYDTTGMNNDGFGGHYSFIRRNPDSTLVIFEQKGPGVINRIWTPTPTNDTFDFYIDDEQRPAFSISYLDLFSGKVFPFVAPLCANQLGGYYCYLPIPFSKYCKIVLKAKRTRFHQVGYRLYPPATKVKSFSLPVSPAEEQVIRRVKKLWEAPNVSINDIYAGGSSLKPFKKTLLIKAGQTLSVYERATAGRIAGFELIAASSLDSVAKKIDLRITWDNENMPAVYCPLADFFGYSFARPSMQGLLIGSDGKRHYSWFPMPFDKSAKIELVYRKHGTSATNEQVQFQTIVYFDPKPRNTKSEGKFYATWHRENPVPDGKPFTMLDATGKGHLAGVVLQSQGLVPGITGFFEGDDSTVIDGELRFHGTGSEDFFNGGWYALLDCWDDAMSLPLSGSLEYSIPLARTGGYRYFLGDKFSFNRSIHHSIEHGPEFNRWPADYTSVSYFYCDLPNKQWMMPSNENTKLYLPDTLDIYPQLMMTAMDESIAAEAKWDGTPAKTMFYTVAGNSLLKMSLEEIPPGEYDVYFDYRKRNDAVQFSVWQRQTQLSEWIDAYSPDEQKLLMQKITQIRLTELNNSISFRFRTTGQRNKFILTRIVLVRR